MGEIYSIRTKEPGIFSEQELFEGMSPDQIKEFVQDTNDRIEELHRIKQLAIDVLGGYGQEVVPIL